MNFKFYDETFTLTVLRYQGRNTGVRSYSSSYLKKMFCKPYQGRIYQNWSSLYMPICLYMPRFFYIFFICLLYVYMSTFYVYFLCLLSMSIFFVYFFYLFFCLLFLSFFLSTFFIFFLSTFLYLYFCFFYTVPGALTLR